MIPSLMIYVKVKKLSICDVLLYKSCNNALIPKTLSL